MGILTPRDRESFHQASMRPPSVAAPSPSSFKGSENEQGSWFTGWGLYFTIRKPAPQLARLSASHPWVRWVPCKRPAQVI